jgi:hypothetical protein
MGKKQRGGEWSLDPRKWFSSTAADVRDVAVSAAPPVKTVATDEGTKDLLGKTIVPEDAGKTLTGGRRTRKHRKHAKKTHRRRR